MTGFQPMPEATWTCPDCLALVPVGQEENHRRTHPYAYTYPMRTQTQTQPLLVNSIDRSLEAFKLLRALQPYLKDRKPRDDEYDKLVFRVDRLIIAEGRGSDGSVT